MKFKVLLEAYESIYKKATTDGLKLWRGWKTAGDSPADPGDFGAGTYYTTHQVRAKQYGPDLKQHTIIFKNPLVMTVKQAYDLADKYHTVRGTQEERKNGALEMSRYLRSRGHDCLIAVTVFRGVHELEVVDFRELR
jgi:hypothetical protein